MLCMGFSIVSGEEYAVTDQQRRLKDYLRCVHIVVPARVCEKCWNLSTVISGVPRVGRRPCSVPHRGHRHRAGEVLGCQLFSRLCDSFAVP